MSAIESSLINCGETNYFYDNFVNEKNIIGIAITNSYYMKIALITHTMDIKSGETRFATNLAKGLISKGIDTHIFCTFINKQVEKNIPRSVKVHFYKSRMTRIDTFRLIAYSSVLTGYMEKLIEKASETFDYYIVISDNALQTVSLKRSGKWVYIGQGSLLFLYFSKKYAIKYRITMRLLGLGLSRKLIKHSDLMHLYDLAIGNSEFTRNFLSHIYNFPFIDFVFPPVDDEVYKPKELPNDKSYVLALLRSNLENSNSFIQQLNKKVKVVIVGGAQIEGCENLGFVNEEDLPNLYSNAKVTLSLNIQEYYGYSIAESLSCGTPVIALRYSGAPELITDGVNGWLFTEFNKLVDSIEIVIKKAESMRQNAFLSSNRFTISQSTEKLIKLLQNIP